MKFSTLSITTLMALANALDTSSPFSLKVHKPGSDIDGTRLSILEDDMFLANEGGIYLFTLSNNGSMMTQYGPGIEFDHDDEVETSSKGRKITAGLKFDDQDILQIPGTDMGLIACPVVGKDAEYAVKSGGGCANGISFEAKAQNEDKAPGWPKSGDNSDVDTSKSFGLVPEADGQDFEDMALVMLDGDMWLSHSGDATYTLDNGVLKTSYGKGIEFDHDDQVETSSDKFTSGVTIDNGEVKVPGNDMGFRLCPADEGKVAPYKVKSGGNCRNGTNITVKVAPLDNDRDASAAVAGAGVYNNNSDGGSSASSDAASSGASSTGGSSASSTGESSASSTGASSASSTGSASGSSSQVTGAAGAAGSATTMGASATGGNKNTDSTSSSGSSSSSSTADNANSAAMNIVSAGAVAAAFAALLI